MTEVATIERALVADVTWTRADRFAGWYGRTGKLKAPIFVVEYRADDATACKHEWVLRSMLPGYASARWSFAATPSLRALPPDDLQAFARDTLRSFASKLLDVDGADDQRVDVPEVPRRPAGRGYQGAQR